jgi:hypothetical protein
MPTLDPRFDAYIAKAAPFARPILKKLRALVHAGCLEVVETMKWSSPAFEFHGPLAQMAAFKAHCTFGFWKGKLVAELATELDAMGQFGRIASLADLPADEVVIAWTRKAAELNASGIKAPAPKKHPTPPLAVPPPLGRRAREAEAREGEALLRLPLPQPPPRVPRMDHRSQARRDPSQTPRHDPRVARRGEGAELEVRAKGVTRGGAPAVRF